VTVNALVALTGCTPKQARTAFAKATEQGILTKTGEGGATRYRYSTKLRIVK
jgi:glutamate synthase domain-containing protein 2